MTNKYNLEKTENGWKMYNNRGKECARFSDECAKNLVKTLTEEYEEVKIPGRDYVGLMANRHLSKGESLMCIDSKVKLTLKKRK